MASITPKLLVTADSILRIYHQSLKCNFITQRKTGKNNEKVNYLNLYVTLDIHINVITFYTVC